jgi:RNA polymerase sigma-70 factor (ECF subfamily)
MERLSPERQHLILLKYVVGLSNAEIGRVLGKTEGAIKSMLRRTLSALRRELDSDHARI